MPDFDVDKNAFCGPHGSLVISADDEISRKLAMLIEGECTRAGPKQAAQKFGFSRQRYFQLRAAFLKTGAPALMSRPRGPKSNYRRSKEAVCQAIRHRFLDPDASSDGIAQKLQQCGFQISKRSVDRIFAEYGLQKKTPPIPASPAAGGDGSASDQEATARRAIRSGGARAKSAPTAGRQGLGQQDGPVALGARASPTRYVGTGMPVDPTGESAR